MDRIRELLAALANPAAMPHDELISARDELGRAAHDWSLSPEATTDEGAALFAEVATALDGAGSIIEDREQTIAERQAAMAETLARVAPIAEAEAPEEPEAGGGSEAAEPEAVPAAEDEARPPAAEEPAAEPIAAAADPPRARAPIGAIAARQPAQTRPQADEPRGPVVTAAPDLREFSAGQELTSREAAEAMLERLDSARMADKDSPPAIMRAGRISWAHQYPEERRLLKAAPEATDQRFAGVIGEYPGDPRALTPAQRDGSGLIASGGLCAPVSVRYELETVSSADRPLRGALPSFNADRGGIQFNSPAHLVDILADTASAALTTTTVANDASGTSKTVQEAACGTLQTVQVRALAERLQFSNFTDRYNPERMAQHMQLARAAHSRLAERQLFEDMQTSSTLVSGGAVWVGATRQWFSNLLAAAEGQRYRHRIAEDYPLRAVLPRWFVSLVAVDLGLQSNGEQTVLGNFEAEAVISRWLAKANIRPAYQRDDARTNNALGAGAPAFGAQTGSGAALNDYPGRMTTLLFPEGSFLFLDGGSLDFGMIRDSTLNALNRFQTFYETFEGVAFVGVESLAIVTLVCASGQGIAGTTTTKCGGVGS